MLSTILNIQDISASNSNSLDSGNHHERQLWQNLRKGKVEALEGLFRLFYALLYDYGLKLSGQEELVKDCVQETFVTIWEKRKRLAQPASVKAYLLVSLRRQVLKAIERQTKSRNAYQEYGQEQPVEVLSAEDLLILAEMSDSEKRRLRDAFATIPARMREALYLKTYDGLSYREIAEVMDISSQVARNYVSEAFKRLKELLASP
ncbi:MAG: RNA polymerase sigma factor [bacterium]